MKRILICVVSAVGLTLGMAGQAKASWSELGYSGYQPWWNIFAKRYKCLTPEEERLQKFWHDYYDALKNYYCALDHIDWVAYYKNHGIPAGGGACGGYGGGRINYLPVVVTPGIQWGVPNGPTQGPMCPPMPYGGPGMQPPPGMAGGQGMMPPGY